MKNSDPKSIEGKGEKVSWTFTYLTKQDTFILDKYTEYQELKTLLTNLKGINIILISSENT